MTFPTLVRIITHYAVGYQMFLALDDLKRVSGDISQYLRLLFPTKLLNQRFLHPSYVATNARGSKGKDNMSHEEGNEYELQVRISAAAKNRIAKSG